MFISAKRHEREKQELLGASNRLTEAILKTTEQGLFLLDGKDKIQPQVSQSLGALFRRQDFSNLSFEKLIAPIVTAKVLTVARSYVSGLLERWSAPGCGGIEPAARCRGPPAQGRRHRRLRALLLRVRPDRDSRDPRLWLVRVTDITLQVQTERELEELRAQIQTQGEMLRSVLQMGGARFAAFLQRTDASMKTINAGPEKAGPGGRGIPRQARGGSRGGRSCAARCGGIQAERPGGSGAPVRGLAA